MSDEMKSPDDLRLTDELAACEARLAGQPLAAPRIDRDQLLYRAGWAAAEVELNRRSPVVAKVGPGRRTIAAWSLTSSLLAASLAIVVTHAVISESQRQTIAQPANAHPPLIVATTPPSEAGRPRPRPPLSEAKWPDLDAIVSEASRANRRPPAAAFLAAYERQPGSRWDEPIIVSHADDRPSEGAAESATSAPLTARGWLDELLPTARRRDPAGNASPLEDPQTSRPRARGEQAI